MADERSKRRTAHGQQRHREGTRPTAFAFHDRDNPEEVYEQQNGRTVYVGQNGRTHVLDKDSHLTSFRTTRHERREGIKKGYWRRVY